MKKKKLKMKVPQSRRMRVLSQEQIKINKEVEYIIDRAEEGDSRVVSLGQLLFFSTETMDAWLLDPEDELAICLLRDGERQDFKLLETSTNFSIEWQASYEIRDRRMIVYWNTGRVSEIIGYPVDEILQSIG